MASINGIQLKAIKTTRGMEGTGFTANIYLDGKKVGEVFDTADGGCYNYSYCDNEKKQKVIERIKEHFEKHPPVDTFKVYSTPIENIDMGNLPREAYSDMLEPDDCFFSELYVLNLREKDYKKNCKKGYPVLVFIDFLHAKGSPRPLPTTFSCVPEYDYIQRFEEEKKKSKLAYMEVYKSLKDFEKE